MSKKSFKIARKPGQGSGDQSSAAPEPKQKTRVRKSATAATVAASDGLGPTTRKTIEVPEDYFRRVKIRAVERGILEKELWAEILGDYFKNHPTS
jgi:predicted DNA binding CopG/RHH family protein